MNSNRRRKPWKRLSPNREHGGISSISESLNFQQVNDRQQHGQYESCWQDNAETFTPGVIYPVGEND
jgi:hypothetical protein